jgi:hypothetical protein
VGSQPTIVSPLIFNDRAASQSSMTRTMSVNDQSLVVTPAGITADDPKPGPNAVTIETDPLPITHGA